MNLQESNILRTLLKEPFVNQRILAETSGHSLGIVNRSLRSLIEKGYLNEDAQLTGKVRKEFFSVIIGWSSEFLAYFPMQKEGSGSVFGQNVHDAGRFVLRRTSDKKWKRR